MRRSAPPAHPTPSSPAPSRDAPLALCATGSSTATREPTSTPTRPCTTPHPSTPTGGVAGRRRGPVAAVGGHRVAQRHLRSGIGDHPPPRRRGLSAPNRLVPDAAGSANPVDGAPERHTRVREGRAEGRDARLCGQVRVSRATAARSRCAFAAGARALRPVRHEHPRKRDAHPRVGGRPRSALRSNDDQRGACRSNDSMSMICFVIA